MNSPAGSAFRSGRCATGNEGTARPPGRLVLLHVIRENPRVVLQAVRKARLRDTESLAAIEPRKTHRAPPTLGDRPPALKPRGARRRR